MYAEAQSHESLVKRWHPELGRGLPLFTELPRRGVLGNWASGVRNSRKPNFCHYSFSQTPYIGVVLYVADRSCMHEIPLIGVLGNSIAASPNSRKLGGI
jgi:hypothetical protein